MSTLYRDYRPQNFSEILGQNHIKITLQNELSANKIAQAFLFCGPRAVGKTTLARVLAKAVNCLDRPDGEYNPCNKCTSCLSITAGKNLDVVEIDAASNTGVDNVRENIIAFSRLAPSNSKFKVFIIDEVHMLSLSAFNALLKIIEEPPVHVIFILCTTEIHKVPLTIISRCERFDFKRISVADVVKKLTVIASAEKISVDREVLEAVARRSGGHLRDAESLLGQIFSLGDKKIGLEQAELIMPHYNSSEAIDILDFISRKDTGKALSLINSLSDSGVNIKNFNAEIINLARKILLNKLSPGLAENLGLDLGENLEKRLNLVAANLETAELITMTRKFLLAYNDQKNPLIPQLALELAVAEICLGFNEKKNISESSPTNSSRSVSPLSPKIDSRPQFKTSLKSEPLKEVSEEVYKKAIINLDQASVLEKWPEFLIKIKKYNHSLSFVMQNCQPQEIKSGQLCLIFKYKFHQDRINDQSIKGVVEKTLAEVFGSALTLNSVIDENLEIRKEESAVLPAESSSPVSPVMPDVAKKEESRPSGGLISDLLKNFGGEVIN